MLHHQNRKTRRSTLVVTSVATAVIVSVVGWRYFSPADYAAVSWAAAEATLGSSNDRVSKFMHPEEMKAFGMTEEKAKVIINEVLRPRMTSFEIIGLKGKPIIQDSRISTIYRAKCQNGVFDSGTEVVETSNGPKTFLSLVALQALRGIQKSGELGNDNSWREKWNSMADDLTAKGLSGYYDLQSGKIYSWPKL